MYADDDDCCAKAFCCMSSGYNVRFTPLYVLLRVFNVLIY